MKVDYRNWLTKLASMVGVTGITLFVGLPSQAKEVLNSQPTIFEEATYNGSQKVLVNTQYTTNEPALETAKNQKSDTKILAQGGGALNPRPSILDECPYNRAACDGTGTPTRRPLPPRRPVTPPTTPPGTTVPTIPPEAGRETKNVIALAESDGQFTILVDALKKAGLIETLQGEGPFTIFAPNDEAFRKIPADALADLLKPENKEVLVTVLKYHVVPGKLEAKDLKSGQIKSLHGDPINVTVDPNTGVMVNDTKVIKADIEGSNGIIHVIPEIIIPPTL
ncbi:MAG: fasciclin domain-containing protein [Nostocaceae cyanobacterium]|nr:fasciclin domain-containing protein [Nostocaceae cyanobacterium]